MGNSLQVATQRVRVIGPPDPTSDHQVIEERSIALHWAVIERIRRDPRLMEIARANLYRLEQRFPNAGETLPGCLLEWKAILQNLRPNELEAFLLSSGEEARRLRQSSPFSGVLIPRERWEIYEAFSHRAYCQGRQWHHRGREIVILGKQAILGQFPDAPEGLLRSVGADVFPKNFPELF